MRFVAQVRLRAARRSPDLAPAGGRIAHQDRRLVVSCRIAGGRPGDVRRGHRQMPRADAHRRCRWGTLPASWISAADFRWTICSAACRSRNSAHRFASACSSFRPAMRVIAEPGRYIAAPAAISVTSVMGRALRGGRWWYYLDDGLYGSYSGQVYDHALYPVEALVRGGETYPSVLAGPTCDSIDVINEHLELPKLEWAISSSAAHGRLHVGLGFGIQFLSARHGAGARRRPAAQRQDAPSSAPMDGAGASVLKAGGGWPVRRLRACWRERRPAARRRRRSDAARAGDAPQTHRAREFAHRRAAGHRILPRGAVCARCALGHRSAAAGFSHRRAARHRSRT